MAYTPAELELISIASELVGEEGLEEQSKAFLAEFPEKLGKVRDYFLNYLEYKRIINEYYQLRKEKRKDKNFSKEDGEALEQDCLMKLSNLGLAFEKNLKKSETGQDGDLVEYMQVHLEVHCRLDKAGAFSLKDNRSDKEREIHSQDIEKRAEKLAKKGFSPVQILRADAPGYTIETQLDAYKTGSQANDFICKIKLAGMYLNNRMSKGQLEVGVSDEQAVDFLKVLKEGVEKGIPSAIATVGRFLDDYMKVTKFLSNGQASPEHLREIMALGELALSICPNEAIKEKIKAALKLGEEVARGKISSEKAVEQLKPLIKNTSEEIDKFSKGAKLSETRASEIAKEVILEAQLAKELALEARLTIVIDSLIKKIEVQQEKYQHRLERVIKQAQEISITNPLDQEMTRKIMQLEKARKQLIDLKAEKSDLSHKLAAIDQIAKRLHTDTKDLPPSNPLKRFINKLLSKNYFKSYAHNVAKESQKMLFAFQQKMQRNSEIERDPTTPSFKTPKTRLK